MKRWAAALLAALCLLSLTGCGTRPSLTVVQAIGLDYNGGSYTLTVQMYDPQSEQPMYETATARTLPQAFADCAQPYGDALFFGCCELIVLGMQAADTVLQELVDYLYNAGAVRLDALMAVAQGSAGDLLTEGEEQGEPVVMAVATVEALRAAEEQGGTVLGTLLDTTVALRGVQGTLALPLLSASMDGALDCRRAAVLGRDGVLLSLSEGETQALAWLCGDVTQAVVSLDDSANPDRTAELRRVGLKIVPTLHQDKLYFHIDLSVEGSPTVSAGADRLAALEQAFADKLHTDVEYLLYKLLVRDGRDPLRLAELVRQQFPAYFAARADDPTALLAGCTLYLAVDVSLDGAAGTGRGMLR